MENLNAEQLLKIFEHCSKSKYCDGCSMRYNPRFLEARSFDPDFSCGKMLIRWAVSIIKSQEQRIKELTEEKKKSDRVFSDLYKETETYLAQRECLRNQVKNLTEENERLRVENARYEAENHAEFNKWLKLEEATKRHHSELFEEAKIAVKEETVRKMHSEIKERCIKGGIYPAFVARTIDQIAKEMLEGENEKETKGL